MTFSVSEWEGEVLEMARISRLDMGAYLCIASNGVPPTVSKRVKVSVDCEYFENLGTCLIYFLNRIALYFLRDNIVRKLKRTNTFLNLYST